MAEAWRGIFSSNPRFGPRFGNCLRKRDERFQKVGQWRPNSTPSRGSHRRNFAAFKLYEVFTTTNPDDLTCMYIDAGTAGLMRDAGKPASVGWPSSTIVTRS